MPIIIKAQKLNVHLDKKSPQTKRLLQTTTKKRTTWLQLKQLSSFELFCSVPLKKYKPFFQLEGFRSRPEKRFGW